MNDQQKTRQDDDDDGDIRSLMAESDYRGRARDDFKRELLRELNHNFSYHPLRTRVLPVAVVVVVAALALWKVTDVGSDGFILQPTGRTLNGDPVVEAPMTGARFNAPAVDGSAEEGIAAAQDVYEQVAAGAVKVLRLEIWIIGGETVYMAQCEIERDGKPELITRARGGTRKFNAPWLAFRSGPGREALEAIERGTLAPATTESVHYLDQDFTMGVWTWNTVASGPIVYKRSLP
ncbi:MAG: hypothetical protein IPJ24_10820 [bacterium]|nr:hypothetical protein [bacterium]